MPLRPLACVVLISLPLAAQDFKSSQLKNPRVRVAQREKEDLLRREFQAKHLAYPPREILIRAFKHEAVFELWTRSDTTQPFALFKEYRICASSGGLGPKRIEGDRQVPEGFYSVELFNPASQFYLSLRVNYPNASDRILSNRRRPGGDIYIHGDCVTLGCIPLTDEGIKEVYWLAVEARAAGQRQIPIHIFPARLDDAGLRKLRERTKPDPVLWAFWLNLKEGYDYFAKQAKPPAFGVASDGRYTFADNP
jgi:murein L,D-transpeptidase YafK